jgi:hypothetical protein
MTLLGSADTPESIPGSQPAPEEARAVLSYFIVEYFNTLSARVTNNSSERFIHGKKESHYMVYRLKAHAYNDDATLRTNNLPTIAAETQSSLSVDSSGYAKSVSRFARLLSCRLYAALRPKMQATSVQCILQDLGERPLRISAG